MLDYDLDIVKTNMQSSIKLNDLAGLITKNLLTQWNIKFKNFCEDKFRKNILLPGIEKPNLIITYNNKSALLDFKGKNSDGWIVNKKTAAAYSKLQRDLNLPAIISFFIFNDINMVKERRFAILNVHGYLERNGKRSRKNKTVVFPKDLPVFNKENLLRYIFN